MRQGFKVSVYPAPLSPGLSYLICTHPASDKLYFIWPKWLDGKSMDMRVGRGRMMSRAWFEDKSKLRSQSFTDVMKAMDEGRLVTAFAGIQNVDSPTVYFFRPADLSALSR
ncbi:hypothetical protein AO262_02770 [Pseudomonas fluorescens ABAC62]|nr:hypothetical protein AO262_02770 [Pseudomonas fluorescens ABAC62]